jgi:hypothetical protein
MATANPWAHSRTEDQRDIPTVAEQQINAYAVPPLSAGDAYIDEFGWAPHIGPKPSTVEVPSAQRLQTIKRYDYSGFVDSGQPEAEDHGLDNDKDYRYSVEDQDADGWNESKGIQSGDLRWADNPRRHPPAETRLTEVMAPRTYSFTRFFDQLNRTYLGGPLLGSARSLNGQHFSMADHRRQYDIMGMAPARSRRNTYRLEPQPWDTDVVDLPPNNGTQPPDARVRTVEIPANSRSYRLM